MPNLDNGTKLTISLSREAHSALEEIARQRGLKSIEEALGCALSTERFLQRERAAGAEVLLIKQSILRRISTRILECFSRSPRSLIAEEIRLVIWPH